MASTDLMCFCDVEVGERQENSGPHLGCDRQQLSEEAPQGLARPSDEGGGAAEDKSGRRPEPFDEEDDECHGIVGKQPGKQPSICTSHGSGENWPPESPGSPTDGHDVDERGEWRTEARKRKEMVAQFYEGAGSKLAAYEEFPSTLRYETRVNDSGEVEEKLVGIAFTPEPFISTARRVARVLLFQLATALVFAIAWALFCLGCWPMCEYKSFSRGVPWIVLDFLRVLLICVGYFAAALLMAEGDGGLALRRFVSCWQIFMPGTLFMFSRPVVHHFFGGFRVLYRTYIEPLAAFVVSFPLAFIFFRFSAHRNKTVVRHRKVIYSLQLTLMFSINALLGSAIRIFLLPLATRDTTDGERTRVVFGFLLIMWPLLGLVTATNRAIRDGSALQTAPCLAFGAVAHALFPRMLQSKMALLSPHQILTSVALGCFDLLTDIAIPYCVLIGGASSRLFIRLVARCKPNQRETQDQQPDAVDIIAVRDESNSDRKPGPSLSRLSTRAASYRRSKSAAFDRLRCMFSRSLLASQLSTILDAQSKFVTARYHPMFLRRLSDQVHLYGLAELTALIFSNLCSIIFEQILSPSGERLAERLAGLGVLVLIEMSLEFLLFCYMVRVINLPLIRSEREPKAVRMRLTGMFFSGSICVIHGASNMVVFVLQSLDREAYGSVELRDYCPHDSFLLRRHVGA
ncbi:unnamed protein product [Vitrella brassicaformis CCMP3155]|uniref:Transmembrane protein n=1 Tax=Vitrella brassicaformis (strain CCMP3155) TaxID=1169540 RepID=A0A0G4EA09_VITBC|nr:unnamed protein product [Vitrella brassicaformis CCMP3155]|eukprot:CEL92051.1 unnamed protein product [Vitrella brassicaformis CCMP3155]